MARLDTLGQRHKDLQAELDSLRDRLADAIRDERAKGVTYQQLLERSGYQSVETIRQIIKPEARDAHNRRRRAA